MNIDFYEYNFKTYKKSQQNKIRKRSKVRTNSSKFYILVQ